MSKVNPLISLVIPVYNVEKYLLECLESVLNQSYKNLQIIIVNDGSTDSSPAILNTINDPRIEIYHKENGGLSSARNHGLQFAKGDYLSFVDSDDVLHPQYVELLYLAIIHTGACMSRAKIQDFSANLPKITIFDIAEVSMSKISQETAISDLYSKNTLVEATVAPVKLYPKVIYQKINFPLGKLHEDVAIALDVLLECETIAVVDAVLYYYRQNPASIMHAGSWRHIDGIDFYENHAEKLASLNPAYSDKAYLAAFKTALQCASDLSTPKENKKNPQYKLLINRIKYLAKKIKINNLRSIDLLFVYISRVFPRVSVTVYRKLLVIRNLLG